MSSERSRDRRSAMWPTALRVFAPIAGALVLYAPDRPRVLKSKQVQRLFRGELEGPVSGECVVTILRAIVRRFLLDDPLILRLVMPDAQTLADQLGVSSVAELHAACARDSRVAEFVSRATDVRRAVDNVVQSILGHFGAWDEFLNERAKRCPTPPPARWRRAQLRISVAELAVFWGYLAFATKTPPQAARPPWCTTLPRDRTIRGLLRARRAKRTELARHISGPLKTIDRWCDEGRRPSDGRLVRIAKFLARPPTRPAALHLMLRRHFALRDLFLRVAELIGEGEANDLADGLHRIARSTYDRLAETRVLGQMHALICQMVTSDHMKSAPSPVILSHLLAQEHEPRWRATLRAMRLASARHRWSSDGHLHYPRPPLMTELTDAVASDLFIVDEGAGGSGAGGM